MPVSRAVTAFKENRLNCAQSVLHAFQQRHNISEEDIAQARRFGNGKAEDGMCGALYAALELARDSAARDRLRSAFATEAGSVKCEEISIPCVECVRLAASLLIEHSGATSEVPLS